MESKVCSSCGQNKLLSQFHRNRGTKDGRGACCKKCKAQEYKALSSEDLDKRYGRELKRKYGLTLDDYDVLYSKQNKRCGICKTTKPGDKKKYFCVDHNHATGKVRGLLCQSCNTGLGLLKDQVCILESAIDYLKRVTDG